MKISPQEIAFDVDGVFADTFRTFVDMARNNYGLDIDYEDITDYNFREVMDIDDQTSQEIVNHLLTSPIEIGIRPIPGAVEVLTRLSRLGPILFVTARPGKEAIFEWIQHQLVRVDGRFICLEATGNHEEKPLVLLQHGIRFFVEDRLDTCFLLEKASVNPIVFEQPWNRKPHPFPIAKDWEDIAAMIDW